MGTFRKGSIIGVTCWELTSHCFKALVLQTLTYGIEIWDLKNSISKTFKKSMKIHIMSHIEIHSLMTYHILLTKFGELSMKLYTPKPKINFQQWLTHLPSSWLVKQSHYLVTNDNPAIYQLYTSFHQKAAHVDAWLCKKSIIFQGNVNFI